MISNPTSYEDTGQQPHVGHTQGHMCYKELSHIFAVNNTIMSEITVDPAAHTNQMSNKDTDMIMVKDKPTQQPR